MIRGRTRDAWRGLNNIEPIHFHFREYLIGQWVGPVLAQLAPAGKLSRVTDVAWSAAKEIRVQREDDFGPLRTVNRVDVGSESYLRSLTRTIAYGRLPLVPFGPRIERQKRLNLRGERR